MGYNLLVQAEAILEMQEALSGMKNKKKDWAMN